MRIRPAEVSDVPAILPMVERICEFHRGLDPAKYGFLPEPSKRYERWLEARAQEARGLLLVAEADAGGLCGFVVGTVEREIPIYRVKEYGFIHDLWVEPECRRQGAGRLLVMAALDRFGQIGVEQVRLDVAAGNEPARRLFASCGLRPSTIEMLREMP